MLKLLSLLFALHPFLAHAAVTDPNVIAEINGKKLTESEFLAATDAKKPSASCEGKIVTVDGKRYRLVRA